MKDMETIRLYQELVMWCEKVDWKVEISDMHGRFKLSPVESEKALLYSNSLHECIGFVTGYDKGHADGYTMGFEEGKEE